VHRFNDFEEMEKESRFITSNNIKAIFYTSPDYPKRLKHIPSAPLMIFQKGRMDLNGTRMIGIVGTRKPTAFAKEFTEQLVSDLATYNCKIISGLAYGIDGCVHRSCVKYGIETAGVLAHGLDRIYPELHRSMAHKMVEKGGALLTENFTGTVPDRENFPKRNRIVSGLVDAIIVIESSTTGGSMITANLAFQYNREVLAVPTSPISDVLGGCNSLIKTNRAHLMESADDVARILNYDLTAALPSAQLHINLDLNPNESRIFEALKARGIQTIDALSENTGLTVSKLAMSLLEMEFRNLVRNLPGKQYQLV
jgi:DNA processing protein